LWFFEVKPLGKVRQKQAAFFPLRCRMTRESRIRGHRR
jgi:hypothetical protein